MLGERDPLTPHNCDLRDFPRMMVDIPRLRGSSFDAIGDDHAWRAGFNLWLTAWHQVPAASLDGSDASLAKAAGLGRDLRAWRKISALALKGWVACSDGRLYHETIAEIALEAWIEKLGQRLSSGAGNAKRYAREFDAAPINAEIVLSAALLMLLNPKSKALSRQHVMKAMATPPLRIPVELPVGANQDRAGTASGVPREGKGREDSSEDKSSAPERVVIEPDADAWDGAVKLLTVRSGMTEQAARRFFGALLKGVQARELLPAVASAIANETRDPKSYLTRAAQAVKDRKAPQPQKRVGFV